MTNNRNELTIENSAVVLINQQPMVAFALHSIPHDQLINNVALLAQAAKNLGVPTVLTTTVSLPPKNGHLICQAGPG